MKRIISALIALAVVIGLGTSCQKEMESRQETSGDGAGLKVTAAIVDNGTKVSYQEDNTDHSLQPGWEVGDIIIGFDGNDGSKTYGYKVTGVNDDGVATLAIITEGNEKGSSTSDPENGTKMYMFYAPGKKPSDISDKSLTVSIASQAKDTVPTLMMAQATVANGSLSLSFTNKTAIIGVKAPVMAYKNKEYTSLSLSGSTGLNTAVTFSLDGDKNLDASYQTPGTLTKELDFTSDETTGKGPDVIYIVACPAAQQNLSFKFNGTEEYFNVNGVEIAESNYYRLESTSTQNQKFAITAPDAITGGTITTSPSGDVAWGTEVTVTATPDAGYELDGSIAVTGASGSITVNNNKFNMPQENVTVSGTFQLSTFTITPTAVTEGGSYTVQSCSPLADVTTAKMGDVIIVTPSPATGYSGGTVTVKKTDTDEEVTFDTSSNTFTMPAANVTITVTFTHDTYSITGDVTPTSSGAVTFKKSGSDDGITQAYCNDEITVVATPADGYELVSIKWNKESGSDEDITSTKKFTMPAKAVTVTVTFKKTGPEYVEMWMNDGGTKKLKWAKMNLGATKEAGSLSECAGDYYQWGSVATIYDAIPWSSWSGSGNISLNSDNSGIISSGFADANKTYTDNSNLSNTSNDVVMKRYPGTKWRMPTSQNFKELFDACGGSSPITLSSSTPGKGIYWLNKNQNYITDYKGVDGLLFVDGGGNLLFFPAAGYGLGTSLNLAGSFGYYWSSSLYTYYPSDAYYLYFDSSSVDPQNDSDRYFGFPVRPVSD